MELFEAYEQMRATSGQPANPTTKAAGSIVYKELCLIAKQLRWASSSIKQDDVINDCFLILLTRGTRLKTQSNDAARGYLRRTLRSQYVDQIRKAKRTRVVEPLSSLENDAGDGDNFLEHSALMSANGEEATSFVLRQHRSILGKDIETQADAIAHLLEYLKEHVAPLVSKKEKVQIDTRRAVDELHALRESRVTIEQLIDANIGAQASAAERKTERNRIQRHHSRSRDRLLEWITKAQSDASPQATPPSDGAHPLTDLDFTLLREAVMYLRGREPSKKK